MNRRNFFRSLIAVPMAAVLSKYSPAEPVVDVLKRNKSMPIYLRRGDYVKFKDKRIEPGVVVRPNPIYHEQMLPQSQVGLFKLREPYLATTFNCGHGGYIFQNVEGITVYMNYSRNHTIWFQKNTKYDATKCPCCQKHDCVHPLLTNGVTNMWIG